MSHNDVGVIDFNLSLSCRTFSSPLWPPYLTWRVSSRVAPFSLSLPLRYFAMMSMAVKEKQQNKEWVNNRITTNQQINDQPSTVQ